MAQTRYYSSAARKTILVDPVDATATQLIVTGAVGYPATFPFTLILDRDSIEEEVVECTALNGDTFTVTRGVDGTSAVAHAAGATVEHGTSARDFRESDQHRSSAEHVHGIELGSEVVGTTDTQTLTNKTLDSPVIINPTLQGEIIDGGGGPDPNPPIDIVGDVDMHTYRVTNMGDAVDDQDAVTKSQLDAQIDLVNGATVEAGSTTTGAPGTDASVVNVGTQNAAVFDFTIPRGDKGETGDAFTYDDFTPEQLEGLKGDKGDAFTYDDFTPEQLEGLKGDKGDKGDGVQIVDIVDSAADLPDPNSYGGSTGDIIITDDDSHGWVFDADVPEWNDIGELRGPKGEDIVLPDPPEAGLVLTSTVDSYEWAESQGGGIDLTSDREDQLIQGDGSGGWAAGMAMSVVDAVPDDSVGEIGDVVFVTGPGDGGSSGVGGKVLQVVSKECVGNQTTNITSNQDVPGMSLDITPKKDTSVILVAASMGFVRADRGTPGEVGGSFTIKKDNKGLPGGFVQMGSLAANTRHDAALFWLCPDKPATTSQCTYKVTWASANTETTLNVLNDVSRTHLYAIELEDVVVSP